MTVIYARGSVRPTETTKLHAVGPAPLVIECADVEANQDWLPLPNILLVQTKVLTTKAPKTRKGITSVKRLNQMWEQDKLAPKGNATVLYHFEAGVEQRMLPFAGYPFRILEGSSAARVGKLGWPGFDRQADGSLCFETLECNKANRSWVLHHFSKSSRGLFASFMVGKEWTFKDGLPTNEKLWQPETLILILSDHRDAELVEGHRRWVEEKKRRLAMEAGEDPSGATVP